MSNDLKPVITKNIAIIIVQGMIIMKKMRLRVMLLVGETEGKIHPFVGSKWVIHNGRLR